jgi:hypothetical protein
VKKSRHILKVHFCLFLCIYLHKLGLSGKEFYDISLTALRKTYRLDSLIFVGRPNIKALADHRLYFQFVNELTELASLFLIHCMLVTGTFILLSNRFRVKATEKILFSFSIRPQIGSKNDRTALSAHEQVERFYACHKHC